MVSGKRSSPVVGRRKGGYDGMVVIWNSFLIMIRFSCISAALLCREVLSNSRLDKGKVKKVCRDVDFLLVLVLFQTRVYLNLR